MNGVLRIALDYYARTRSQRVLAAIGLLIFIAERVAALHRCPCGSSSPWPYLSGGLAGLSIMTVVILGGVGASYFNRISALRTVFLIPRSRLKLAVGMLIAQVLAAALVTAVVVVLGQAAPSAQSGWGTPRGTFESLFGSALLFAVLLQAVAGPSRVVSLLVGVAVPVAILGFRIRLFFEADVLGLARADFLAIAGLLAWLLFATWYSRAWRSKARAAGAGGPIVPIEVSRQAAIQVFLLGQPSLASACRGQLTLWMLYHVFILAAMTMMKLLIARHNFPSNYSMAIILLLYAPIVGVNTIASCLARGSRRAWLSSGESRDALHANAVRLAWRSLALLGLPLWGLALLEIIVLPHADFDMRLLAAISVSLTPAALYLGLLHFQRRPVLSVLALILVAFGVTFASLFPVTPRGQGLPWLAPIAFVAIGGMLRSLARRRWHAIDWLRFRAERETSPFVMRRV